MMVTGSARWFHGVAWLGLFLALAGCTKPQLHRPHNIERQDGYTVAYIEFDDQGEPWAPSQLERTIQLIENTNRKGKRSVVVLFVHGWNNDASKREDRKKENNVEGFDRLLETTRGILDRAGYPRDDVSLIGVYLSWRGRSTSAKPLKPFTFYSRRGAGQRAAGVSTTEAIVRVMDAAKENPLSAGIVIGHSFGGMIVERALTQAMVGYTVNREDAITPIADMVILINPASQSMNAKNMVSMLKRNRLKFYRVDDEGNRTEAPFIVSVTSTGDTATGNLYPLALGIKGWTKKFRDYEPTDCSPVPNQKVFYKNTAGHNTVLHSHVITTEEAIEPGSVDDSKMVLRESIDPKTGETRYSFPTKDYMFAIERLPWGYNDTPYWIMSVPPELIRGHSDIFTYNTLQMIRALMSMSGTVVRGEKGLLVRENGVKALELVALPQGGIAFLESSRRFYLMGEEIRRPMAAGCLPPLIQPEGVVGVFYENERAYVIASGEVEKGKKTKASTAFLSFDFGAVGSASLESVAIRSEVTFTAGAGDPGESLIYLARAGELYTADLALKKPRAVLMSQFDEAITLDRMKLDKSHNRILAIDREVGNVYLIDLDTDSPVPELVAGDLGLLADVDLSADRPSLLIDSAGKRVLEIDCSQAAGCSEPELFAEIPEFERPITIARTVDDTVWVGDFDAQSLFEFDAEGKLIRTMRSMSGFDE